MARIVIVHGAFNELWGPNELKARWLPAVRDGLWHHGVGVDADDVDVCFYGDLFRHHPGSDEDTQLEQSRAGVADMLADMGRRRHRRAGAGGRRGHLRPHRRHGHRHAGRERPARPAACPHRGRDHRRDPGPGGALVGHGRSPTPRWRQHDDWPVHTFVTLGSPLAVPMVFDSLEPAPVDGQGVWPGSVQRWVNVRAVNDQACETCLTDHFGPAGRGARDRQRPPCPRARALPELFADGRRHRRRTGHDLDLILRLLLGAGRRDGRPFSSRWSDTTSRGHDARTTALVLVPARACRRRCGQTDQPSGRDVSRRSAAERLEVALPPQGCGRRRDRRAPGRGRAMPVLRRRGGNLDGSWVSDRFGVAAATARALTHVGAESLGPPAPRRVPVCR